MIWNYQIKPLEIDGEKKVFVATKLQQSHLYQKEIEKEG